MQRVRFPVVRADGGRVMLVALMAVLSTAACQGGSGSAASGPSSTRGTPTASGAGRAAASATAASSAVASPTGAAMAVAASGASSGTPTTAQSLQDAYVRVVHDVLPSVVEITTSKGLGSGIVYDTKGDIVTNDHVVGSAKSFQVAFSNGARTMPATLVGTYPPDDLAVIRVTGGATLRPATFADSSKVKVGDIVLAMGNPLGLASSVTDGIVSATGRPVTEPQSSDSPGATLPDAIQTSAAINPGNSGGALVDLAEQVVGIPTLAATDQQLGGGAAPGIGFAIPANVVTRIADQLVASGKVTSSGRAALGVSVRTVTTSSGGAAGVGIVSVAAGGAAAKAGLQVGDIIVSVSGKQTPEAEQLSVVLAQLRPGQRVPVTVLTTAGKRTTRQVTLGQLGS